MKNFTNKHSLTRGLFLSVMATSVLLATACAKPEGHVQVTKSGARQSEKEMSTYAHFEADTGLASSIIAASAETALTSAQGATPSFSVLVKILYMKSKTENGVLMAYGKDIGVKSNTTLTIPSDMNCADTVGASRFQVTVSCGDANCNRMTLMLVAKDSAVLPNITGQEVMGKLTGHDHGDASLTGYHVTGMRFGRSTFVAQKRAQQALKTEVATTATVAANAQAQTVVGTSAMELVWTSPWDGKGKSGFLTAFDEGVRNSAAANTTPVGSSCVITLEKALALGMPSGKAIAAPTTPAATDAAVPATDAAIGDQQAPAPVTDASGAPKTGAADGMVIDGPTTTTPQTQGAETPASLATTPPAEAIAAPATSDPTAVEAK